MSDVVMVQPVVGLLDKIKDKPAIPLSLLTAVSRVSRNCKVAIVDQRNNPNWEAELVRELKTKPLCVGTTAMLGPQIGYGLKALSLVKKHSPNTVTVWGGPQGSIMPEITKAHQHIDYVLQGDGEESFKNFVDALAAGRSIDNVSGIWTNDAYAPNKIPWKQIDLNDQPPPPYNLVNVRKYLPTRFGVPTLDMETSRGCPFNCAFCYNPNLHRRNWRALSVEAVFDRIDDFHRRYDVDSFWFIDDEFFVNLERSKSIIEGMIQRRFRWEVQGTTIKNVLKMDDSYLRMLVKSGCSQLNIGVETGSERLLQMMHKPIKLEQVLRVNQMLKAHNIVPSYYFIVGFPTETYEDFSMTLSLVRQILNENAHAKIMNIGCYTPYPSTELMETCIEQGYKPPEHLEDYIHYGVDEVNTPWVHDNADVLQNVKGAHLCNYFIDNKINDLRPAWYIRWLSRAYKPIAMWRFNHKFFGANIDLKLVEWAKSKVGV